MARRVEGRSPEDAEDFMGIIQPRGQERPVPIPAVPHPLPGPVREYRKTATVLARQVHEEVTIVTPEGAMDAHPGDYIASDNPPTHLWPIRREVFEATYVPVADPDDSEVQ